MHFLVGDRLTSFSISPSEKNNHNKARNKQKSIFSGKFTNFLLQKKRSIEKITQGSNHENQQFIHESPLLFNRTSFEKTF